MKNLLRFAILAGLLLALSLLPSAGAEGRLLELDDEAYIRGMAGVGDGIYLAGEGMLYSWREGEDALTAWSVDSRLDNPYAEQDPMYEFALYNGDGRLCGLRILYDDAYAARAIQLFDVTLSDGGTAEAANGRELALPEELRMLEWFNVRGVVCWQDRLYMLCEGDDALLCVIDPEKPRDASVEQLRTWQASLTASAEGPLLAYTLSDGMEYAQVLCRVGEDGTLDELCRLPGEVRGIAADPASEMIYGVSEGRVRAIDPDTGELGEAVAALSLEPTQAVVLSGGNLYAALLQNGVAVADTRSRLDEDALLTISNGAWNDWLNREVQRFAMAHPETPPVMTQDAHNALEAMMTGNSEPDIYVLEARYDANYETLLERGFMLPLEEISAVRELYDSLYPGVQGALSRDGEVMAVPVGVYGSCMRMDDALLGKLGLSVEEVPGDWMGFMDYMERELQPRLNQLGENECFTYDGLTAEGFRFFLLQSILTDWVNASRAAGRVPDYGDARLAEALERLDAMDFTEFGLESTEDEGYGFGWSGDTRYLIQNDAEFTFGDSAGLRGVPLALGFGDDLPGVMALNLTAAFINPYSAHAEAAGTFLEALARDLPDAVRYALCPALNDPLQNPNWEKTQEELENWITDLEAQLESAEAADVQMLQEQLQEAKEALEQGREQEMWRISPEGLAQYRAMGDKLTVAMPSWFDRSGEAWELMQQYSARRISAREFLNGVNQKARMMELEAG